MCLGHTGNSMTITELNLFEAILASEDYPLYDPEKHLSPEVAGKRWHINPKTARVILLEKCEEYGLEEITVRNPKTGKRIQVFIPKRDNNPD